MSNPWIDLRDLRPPKPGWYKIRTTLGEFEAAYSRTIAGKMVWVVPDSIIITHWKYCEL